MRWLPLIIISVLLLSAGAVILNVSNGNKQINETSRGITYWSGEVDVHIEYFKCDPSLDSLDDPDPYFRVFLNDQKITSPVWDNTAEIRADWWANFTVNTRDNVVWIEIAAWDSDSITRDDLIDIDPGDGFTLDLLYNLQTKSWSGDVTGNNASGNQGWDWGQIAFEIYSYQNSQFNVNPPYLGFGRLDSSQVYLDGNPMGDYFQHDSDNYYFNLNSGDDVNINMLPSPIGDYALYLYDPNNQLVASSDSAGYGGMESISYHATTSGTYKLMVKSVRGYGEYEIAINTDIANVIKTSNLQISYIHAYLLSNDWSNLNFRMMGYHVAISVHNPTATSGYVYIHILNLDPDFVVTNYESSTYRGKYSMSILIQLNASETKTVTIQPWHEPQDNFWFFAMGDNRPGCGVLDNPTEPSPEYTLFTHYYTSVIRTPIGWDDGDLVAGFGGGLVAHYDSVPESSLDYVYETEYNRFYMLTGLSDDFFFTTIGNHDVTRYEEHPQHQGEHIYQEYLGKMYYSFNFSNTHFVFPDDYQDDYWSDGTPWWYSYGEQRYGGYIYANQLQWLDNDLKVANESGYTHKIVVMHMPLIVPPGRNESLDDEFINYTNRVDVMNIFKRNSVDYLIVAHIHNYTPYYTNLYYNSSAGEWNVSSSESPEGAYSIFTLMSGTAGAHNAYQDWGVKDLEADDYSFVLAHVSGSEINYHIYKYHNLTDSNGNPLTSVSYQSANDGSEVDEWGVIKNSALYSFPYIRMKFYMSNQHDDYVAYSNITNSYQTVYEHKFKDYTVVYVETSVSAYSDNYIHVYSPNVPEFSPFIMPFIFMVIILIAIALRKIK